MAKVLLLSMDLIGSKMAGPGIRYYEIARVLSKNHEVTLAVPNEPDIPSEGFRFAQWNASLLKNSDVIMTQRISPYLAYLAKKENVRLIFDAYDPEPIEHLEIFKNNSKISRTYHFEKTRQQYLFSLQAADCILAASEKQKDLLIGAALATGKICPEVYQVNPRVAHAFKIVPFGLSSAPLTGERDLIRKKWGIMPTDTLLLWGGGVWNWFDPLTIISALKELNRPDIKLLFMGIKSPNPNVPEMEMARRLIKKAETSGLLDKQLFINRDWLPYEERTGYLAAADGAVSFHFDHLETRYAFRTRILDYLWAELPMILSEGDCLADYVAENHLGYVTPCEDKDALKKALISISDPNNRRLLKENISKIKKKWTWNQACEPLEQYLKESRAFHSISFGAIANGFFRHYCHPKKILYKLLS